MLDFSELFIIMRYEPCISYKRVRKAHGPLGPDDSPMGTGREVDRPAYPSGHRYFNESDGRLMLSGAPGKRATVGYCRVSRAGQKDDLASQVEAMEMDCRVPVWPGMKGYSEHGHPS